MKSHLSVPLLVVLQVWPISKTCAQVSINDTGADPDPSAMLDVSSTSKGALLPRMTAAQRDAIVNPATGLMVYVTTDNNYYSFNGSSWTQLGRDNLGNHTATQNLRTNGRWMSYDGSSNGLFVNAANRVGIGASSFSSRLHVFGGTNPLVTIQSSAGCSLTLDRGTTASEGMVQIRSNGTPTWLMGLDDLPSVNSSDFAIKKSDNGDAEFLIKANGNVGVGSINPLEKLDVNGAVKIGSTVTNTAGTIRWTGDDFEGYTGQAWKSLTDLGNDVKVLYSEVPVNGTPEEDVSQFIGDIVLGNSAGTGRWQSFTAVQTGNLARIEIHHGQSPNFIEDGQLRIYEGDGISGALLHQQSIDNSITNGSWGIYALTGPVPVKAGKQYTVWVVDNSSSYTLLINRANPYGGGTYSINPGYDMAFKTFVIPPSEVLMADETTGDVSVAEGRVYIAANGNVGINTTMPASKLHVKDSFASYTQFVMTVENVGNGSGSGGLLVQAGQNASSPGNTRFIQFNRPDGTQIGNIRQDATNSVFYATTSDERLKTRIVPTAFGLDDLMEIHVRDYCFKDDLEHPQTGFIAQQLHEHYPPAVKVGGEDEKTDPWQVDYSKLTPLLVKSVQDLKAMVDAQARQIESRQRKIDLLEKDASSVQSRLERIEAKLGLATPEGTVSPTSNRIAAQSTIQRP